jgi:hypothetical protein
MSESSLFIRLTEVHSYLETSSVDKRSINITNLFSAIIIVVVVIIIPACQGGGW